MSLDLAPALMSRVPSLGRDLRRFVASIAAALVSARGTTTWLAIVSATQLVLVHANERLDRALLLSTSTNLHNLSTDPLNVLVTSACIVASMPDYIEFLIECVLLLAPLEQALGTLRWVAGLVIGHVGATLIVAIALTTSLISTPSAGGRVIDVGVSYGVTCLAVVFAWHLEGPRRWLLALAVGAFVVSGLAGEGGFTDWGHATAALLGLAIARLLVRRPAVTPTRIEGLPV